MNKYSIKDLELLSNIKSHTIRIWEKRYCLLSPERTDTNIRFYTDADLKKLLNVSFLNNNGFKISKICSMSTTEINNEIIRIQKEKFCHINDLENLTKALIDYNEFAFLKIIEKHVSETSLEDTMTNLISPFLEKVGYLWQSDVIDSTHEHLVSQLIRQKIISETDKLKITPTKESVLLFLREQELHDIALLISNYTLRKKGYQTYFLGQSVPLDDIGKCLKKLDIQFVISHIISYNGIDEIIGFINQLSNTSSSCHFYISSPKLLDEKYTLPSNVSYFSCSKKLTSSFV